MDIIPAVDVLDGAVVRLMRGDFNEVTVYSHDPVAAGLQWIESGAGLVHLVDLAGAKTGEPDPSLWESFGEAGIPFEVGGGIREASHVEAALEAGAARVVMGSAAVWHPQVLAEAVARHGPERVVAAVDVRHGNATGSGWLDEGVGIEEVVAQLRAGGVSWAMVTAITRDGTLAGPDLDLIARVRTAAPELNVIGSGGVGTVGHLIELQAAGAQAAIVGRALYDGTFTLPQALTALAAAPEPTV